MMQLPTRALALVIRGCLVTRGGSLQRLPAANSRGEQLGVLPLITIV